VDVDRKLSESGEFVDQTLEEEVAYIICHEHMHRIIHKEQMEESVPDEQEGKEREERAVGILDILSGLLGEPYRRRFLDGTIDQHLLGKKNRSLKDEVNIL